MLRTCGMAAGETLALPLRARTATSRGVGGGAGRKGDTAAAEVAGAGDYGRDAAGEEAHAAAELRIRGSHPRP